jgi:hypothetical protein
MRLGALQNGGRLPLLVEPDRAGRSAGDLADWLSGERPLVEEKLTAHGAMLFRGFDVGGPAGFEKIARAIDPELKNDYLGTSPRDALTDYVFSASELPPYYPIPQHCEMSFLRDPPRRLFFTCLEANRAPGGETPLVDVRQVWRDLDPSVRASFEKRGVLIVRNYVGPEGGSRLDLWKLKRWDEMFRTTDRAAIEKRCREVGLDFAWKEGGGLRLWNQQPAFHAHPRTGEIAWFNHSQVFHLSAAPAEYRRIARRQGAFRYGLLAAVAGAAVMAKKTLTRPEDQAMHCCWPDWTPISDAEMDAVRDAIWKNLVFFPWQRGDVVAIDNFAVAHGRMPYQGPRKIAVCWA